MRPLPDDVQAVVFDCDGLLVDTEVCWTRAETAIFAAHGHGFGPEQKALVIGRTLAAAGDAMADYFGRAGAGGELAAELLDGVRRELAKGADALPGAVELVKACAAAVPVAVASNSPRELLDTALASAGLAGFFPVSFAADEVESAKPAPDLYLAACAALGADPARSVAFEDSATGIAAARAAGLYVVTVPSLSGAELDHDLLAGSLAEPGLVRWSQGLGARAGR
ncbi:HAD family phosphatase [Streptomyces sp. NBC_01551]|uniref:HAD family hydrolase n=1 Tax=Streptomyces sp. NBC_01551 TaxID=2975876 RepID=UPI00225313AD|nr:HAD family phosphatase [Streptomyces sp. NBC_01551]MCX4527011.1 HAD family phosphatase [Streptomyces sp. NBC_01551]